MGGRALLLIEALPALLRTVRRIAEQGAPSLRPMSGLGLNPDPTLRSVRFRPVQTLTATTVVFSFMDGSLLLVVFDPPALWHLDAARGPSTPSLDQHVGPQDQARRYFESKGSRRFEVDDHLQLRRLLDR
jgi:hypothetical protein